MNALFLAALLFVPGLPESATVDTEASTNVPFAFAGGNLFHRWDLVKVAVCGVGERRFSLSAKCENDGLKVLVR